MNEIGALTTHVALLRSVNVGGKNKLAMRDLAALFTGAGCVDVRTYIQSGNVVFKASAALAEHIAILVTEGLSEKHGLRVPVILRSAGQLSRAARENPFLAEGADPSTLHVAFLADVPEPGRVASLDANRSPPDRFALLGREIFMHCPSGIAKTKLTNQYFDSRLGTTSTMRNLKTVRELSRMAEEAT